MPPNDRAPHVAPMAADMLPAAARLHRDVNPESRSALMGEQYCVAFLSWFLRAEHGGVALAALDSSRNVIGYAVGAPLGYPTAASRRLAWVAARAVARRPWLLLAGRFRQGLSGRLRVLLGRPPARVVHEPDLPAPTLSLVAMGVAQSARRSGVGRRLVEAFEARAAERGMRSLRLSTRADNAAARGLYERCGWRPVTLSRVQTFYVRILPGPDASSALSRLRGAYIRPPS